MNFKTKKIWVLAGLLLFLPALAFAVGQGNAADKIKDKKEEAQAKRTEAICGRVNDWAEKYSSRVDEKKNRAEERWNERYQNMLTKREGQDQKLEQLRKRWDARRAEFYAKLEEKAGSDTKKQAVINFKKAVEAAVKIRKEAIDAAIDDFRDGVDGLVDSRKTERVNAMKTYENSVEAAYAKAKSACDSGTNAASVRNNLKADLKSAKTRLQNEVQATDKIGEKVKALAEARKTAVKKAIEDFKTALEKAKTDFKTALPDAVDTKGNLE